MNINNYLRERPGYNQYGAFMGRPDTRPQGVCRLYLQRVRINTQGYDAGGAYWGCSLPLWCAFGEDKDRQVFVFVRAPDRESAKAIIQGDHSNGRETFITFFR
jgi:hypothetical protein